jgi:NADH:ubiquinone oxidoreductase subunit
MLCRRRGINVVDWLKNRFARRALDSDAARGHKRPVPAGEFPLRRRQINPMIWLARIFTWWNGQTLNTALHTLLFGKFAGKDEFGNRYYRSRKIDKALGFERRWVIYAGESEGSMTPPGWYGWLHHTADLPPTEENYAARAWELPHQANLTGTPQAWRPPGSTLAANARPPATGDYEAWTPEG